MAHKTKSQTARRLVLFGAAASVLTGPALAPVSQAQQLPKPLSSLVSPNQNAKITCHGINTVPMTIDSAQTLPLQLVANVPCGEEVAVLSDFEAYTVAVRTPDGRNGYIARMYLSASSKAPSHPAVAPSAEVKSGVAQWQLGSVGCDQFTSENGVVESVTVNGVTVQVSLQDTGWKMRANIAVANEGSEVLHLNPVHFTLDTVRPAIRALAYQDPDRLAKSTATHQIYRTAANAGPAVMDASFHTSQTRVVSAPNYFSPAVNPQVGFNGSPYAVADTQQYEAAAFREGDVATKSSVAGAVWFERDKRADELLLRVPINGVLFEFPLTFKHEK